jgi:tol-pal system protein YbgF
MVETGRFRILAVGTMAALSVLATPAPAQENELRIIVPRLERLESELADMQRRMARGGGGALPPAAIGGGEPATGAIVRLDDRMSLMERQLAELTGRVEETGFRIEQLRQRVEKLAADIEFRLGQIEKGEPGARPTLGAAAGGAALSQREVRDQPVREQAPQLRPPQTAAAAVPPSTPARAGPVLPDGSPMDRYNFAINLLARQDYPAAEAAFREFVAAHPGDRLTANAQYWLGETYYVRNDMTKAAQAFLEGVKKYPDGPKAADTMLKLGMALTAINQKQEACGVFGEMKNRFPTVSRETATGLAAARERAGCR